MLHALVQVNNWSRVVHLDHQAKHSSQSEMASVKAKNLDRLVFQARLSTKATIKCSKIERLLRRFWTKIETPIL